MSDILQILLQSNTLNFIIVLAIISVVFLRLNIPQKLDKSREEIKSYIDESENEKHNAEQSLFDIKNKIKTLPDEINKIKISTKNNISNMIIKSEEETKQQIENIDGNVNRIMDLETKKFQSTLVSMLSEASINLARDNAKKQLENNRSLHNKFIDEAIEEINKVNL